MYKYILPFYLDPPVVTLREAVNMSCEVEANPPARVLWSVDGVTMTGAGPVTRAGAAVRCLAENPLGVASAENTEMRLRGLEQRLGKLEEERSGGQLPGWRLEQRINHVEEKITASILSRDKEARAMKARTELISMLESRIEVIHEFQRTHIGSHGTLSKMTDILQQDIRRINAKITELDEKVAGMITDMSEEADIPVIEINKFLGHSRVTSSLQSPSPASSSSQQDNHGLFFTFCVLVFGVTLI